MVEPGAGSVELLDQLGYSVFEMSNDSLIAGRQLHLLDLFDQCSEHRLQLVRHAADFAVARGERVGKRRDPLLEGINDIVVS